jgi:hypothetical protein
MNEQFNLNNTDVHGLIFSVNACLTAGRHVSCEKQKAE